MRELQQQIINELGVRPEIDCDEEATKRIKFLVSYLEEIGGFGYVLGISGGIDSTLCGKLAEYAVQEARHRMLPVRFVALRLPCFEQIDEADAEAALKFIRPDECHTINIGDTTDAFTDAYFAATHLNLTDFNRGNVKARLRMVAQFAYAGDNQMLVLGTDHAAEAVTGFYTKFGDGAADVMPLAGLNKRQIRAIAKYIGVKDSLVNKTPTADLLDIKPGRPDEEELGISYDDIDDYLEGKEVPIETAERIEAAFLRTRHKRTMPVTPFSTWWK